MREEGGGRRRRAELQPHKQLTAISLCGGRNCRLRLDYDRKKKSTPSVRSLTISSLRLHSRCDSPFSHSLLSASQVARLSADEERSIVSLNRAVQPHLDQCNSLLLRSCSSAAVVAAGRAEQSTRAASERGLLSSTGSADRHTKSDRDEQQSDLVAAGGCSRDDAGSRGCRHARQR